MDPKRLLALELAEGREPTAGEIEAVAVATSPEAAAWAFTQWRLRARARGKFERADSMLFDQDGLEMASSEHVARLHAARFPEGVRVADLTVGIGADLLALACRGESVGFEIDPDRLAMAAHNLAMHGLRAEIRFEDCLAADWDVDYAFADPSRRGAGRRTLDPAQFQPHLGGLVERMRCLSLGVIKLSPMLHDTYLESLGGMLRFMSVGGECREALLTVGKESVCGDGSPDRSVWAMLVETGSLLPGGLPPHRAITRPLEFLYEADPAAIRAHALGALCDEFDICGLGDSNGYLTGSGLVRSEWLKAYRVLASCSADDKATKAELRAQGASVVAVKSRAPKVDVEELGRKFKGLGDRLAVLVVYAVGQGRRHVITEPVE